MFSLENPLNGQFRGKQFWTLFRLKYDPQNLQRKWEHHDTPKSGRNILSILFCSQDALPRAKVRAFIPLYIHFLNLSEPLTAVSQRAAMQSTSNGSVNLFKAVWRIWRKIEKGSPLLPPFSKMCTVALLRSQKAKKTLESYIFFVVLRKCSSHRWKFHQKQFLKFTLNIL